MADIYIRLSYLEYKAFEAALDSPDRKHQHNSADGLYYHKSIRLPLGKAWIEVQGPVMKSGQMPLGKEQEGST